MSVPRRKGLGTDAFLPCGRKEEATNPEQLFTGGFAFFTSKTEATVVHCRCRFWTGRVFHLGNCSTPLLPCRSTGEVRRHWGRRFGWIAVECSRGTTRTGEVFEDGCGKLDPCCLAIKTVKRSAVVQSRRGRGGRCLEQGSPPRRPTSRSLSAGA